METEIKLEAGKEYVKANGLRTGKMQKSNLHIFEFLDPSTGCEYLPDGKFWLGRTSEHDIVREYIPD